jgi:sarcosine oxidase, subunit alpha
VSNGYRLAVGGLIDRSRILSFTYDGQPYSGHPGDTLASALIASGVNVIGRSFKYHRPRSFYGVGTEDPNSMLAVRDAYGYDPALRAGQVQLCEGLEACSVTGSPSPGFDLAGGLQLLSGILGAGFYYKTFKWPKWANFEPLIRRSTGFGRPRSLPETRATQQRHATFDALIMGGGPAGLATARSLVGSGLTVLLVDDQPQFGGTLNWEDVTIDGQSGATWARGVAGELASDANLTLLTSTTVTAAYEGNHFTLLQLCTDERGVRAECHWQIFAQQVVLATGMVDRPLLFADNDRPGILLSGAVRRLINGYGVSPADQLAIYTNNDSGYLTALAAHRAGIQVAALIDIRSSAQALHADAMGRLGITCHFETQIEATSGYKRLSGITLRDREGRHKIACNGLAVSGGFTPLLHLASHRGIKPAYDARLGTFVANSLPANWQAAGGVTGTLDLVATLAAARQAAQVLATALGATPQPVIANSVQTLVQAAGAAVSLPDFGARSRMWVDFQNDVKVSDIELAVRENYCSVEHLKRYTTLGMGTDQGRTSNFNGLAILADLNGQTIEAVGTTTFRPPYIAVRMATIASGRRGDLFKPRRWLPAHAVHQQRSAVFTDVGWERPDWYRSNATDREAAVTREMAAVRNHVGVFDCSSLGKIEITGPDAAAFIGRFYISNLSTLKPGKVRYSVMMKEDGVILDDGVIACLADHHFLASPTSGNAETVAAWFERWRQTEWSSMRVAIAPVTSQWASIAIAGPRARALLARLNPDFDISNQAFGHMEIRAGQLGGAHARVARVSFTGELQYEISVPARYAHSLLNALLTDEGDLYPVVVGLEAWLRLRLEKGYLHLGSDTNGRTTPLDVGLASVVARRKDDFIGKRSLLLPFATSTEREQLVGLMAIDGALEVGGRILSAGFARPPCPTDGYVTSACFSPSVGKSIGLALIERGFTRLGETVSVYSQGKTLRCQITKPTFYDPDNQRLQA